MKAATMVFTTDLVGILRSSVYRPAGGAGYRPGQRLRLGGKRTKHSH
jgi:hypothetical protein